MRLQVSRDSRCPDGTHYGRSRRAERPVHSSMLDFEFAQVVRYRPSPRPQRRLHRPCSCHTKPEETRNHGWLFALADGVGGQDRGEVASRTAVESAAGRFPRASARRSTPPLLPRLVQAANTQVHEAGLAGQSERLDHGHHDGGLRACAMTAP